MSEEINHEVFGKITFRHGWRKKDFELEMFGKIQLIEIVIDAEEDGDFEVEQEHSYTEFMKDLNKRVNDAEKSVFNYYQEHVLSYREQFGTDADKLAPNINSVEELGNLVVPKQIFFPMIFDEDRREAGFICDCSWDIELGLGIKFVNESIEEVGAQDILI
ncbi:hypothetical protein J9317_03900 [Metabacillus sp. KIGAM252]|uniref:DUF6985 domain-containing protein n=1 Tax=Metabacillus flavus TaxID=2823519 RepID=A0ABS5LB09_9BACI|nr:hypothetical protein [Metabacillus flavus]MBS2967918.1 hypothetical protein [Metabacillus flavus]